MKALTAALLIPSVWFIGVALWIASAPYDAADPRADTAIVLGAAVFGDRPSPVFEGRIDHAITLYEEGRVNTLLFTGGRSAEDTLAESEAAKRFASARGVAPDDILTEAVSRTTLTNLIEAQPLIENSGARRVLIVSDPLHVPRGVIMARSLGLDAAGSGSPTSRYRSWSTWLPFLVRETYFVHRFWLLGE